MGTLGTGCYQIWWRFWQTSTLRRGPRQKIDVPQPIRGSANIKGDSPVRAWAKSRRSTPVAGRSEQTPDLWLRNYGGLERDHLLCSKNREKKKQRLKSPVEMVHYLDGGRRASHLPEWSFNWDTTGSQRLPTRIHRTSSRESDRSRPAVSP